MASSDLEEFHGHCINIIFITHSTPELSLKNLKKRLLQLYETDLGLYILTFTFDTPLTDNQQSTQFRLIRLIQMSEVVTHVSVLHSRAPPTLLCRGCAVGQQSRRRTAQRRRLPRSQKVPTVCVNSLYISITVMSAETER